MATFNGTNSGEAYTGPWGENNIILGNGGKDTLTGGALSDSIDGGNGNDPSTQLRPTCCSAVSQHAIRGGRARRDLYAPRATNRTAARATD